MVLRTNTTTRERFWGCGDYPNCKETLRRSFEAQKNNNAPDLSLPSSRLRQNDEKRWEKE